jgi:hypothetical protein
MLKFTIKISLYSILHVSVHPDHPQGAYAECTECHAASHAAWHSVHTPHPETHVATTLQNL